MARTLSLPRLAARLAVVIPFAAFVPAACGGFDTIPFDSDGAVSPDGALADGTTSDVTLGDSTVGDEMMADGTVGDGTFTDTTVNDARADSADATDSADAAAADAADAFDGTDASLAPFDPLLKSAARFTIFGGSTVSNANTTTVSAGDLGVYPSPTAIGTTPPILLLGAFHLGDSVAQTAQADILQAYTDISPANLLGGVTTASELGGMTLPPGIYKFASSAQITGILTLAAGSAGANAKWFFQIGSTLTTFSLNTLVPAQVLVTGGANPCNVYWQVGTAATISTDAKFSGNILSGSSVTLNTRAELTGRALAAAAVTMDTNTVSIAACPTAPMLPDDAGLDAGTDAADASNAADAADSG